MASADKPRICFVVSALYDHCQGDFLYNPQNPLGRVYTFLHYIFDRLYLYYTDTEMFALAYSNGVFDADIYAARLFAPQA